MIRLIIIAIAILLLWVLFWSNWSKERKITFTIVTVILFGLGVWFEQRGEKPVTGLVDITQISLCDLAVTHSYRSNRDVRFCLKNESSHATVKRVTLRVIAEKCQNKIEAKNCQPIEIVEKDLPAHLPPEQQITLTKNLAFDQVDLKTSNLHWRAEVIEVKAIR